MYKNNIKKLNPPIPSHLVQFLKVNSMTELGLHCHIGHYSSHLYQGQHLELFQSTLLFSINYPSVLNSSADQSFLVFTRRWQKSLCRLLQTFSRQLFFLERWNILLAICRALLQNFVSEI